VKIRFCIGLAIGVVAGVLFSEAGWTHPARHDAAGVPQQAVRI
jgi:hypothetical protein